MDRPSSLEQRKAETLDGLIVNAIAQLSGDRAAQFVETREAVKDDREARAELLEQLEPFLHAENRDI